MMALLDGYPQMVGSKIESVLEVTGPASYTQVSVATPPTGGQAITAKEFGLKYIDHISDALSNNGAYIVKFTPTVTGTKGVTAGILMWITAAGGAEASGSADLDAITVRLRAVGN
jgi:hypothetical protein